MCRSPVGRHQTELPHSMVAAVLDGAMVQDGASIVWVRLCWGGAVAPENQRPVAG